MTPRLKVVFLGNHTVGVRTLRTLVGATDVVGVVAHPQDPEDGVRYESVFAEAQRLGVATIRASAKTAGFAEFVQAARPDLVWVTDFRYLLPASILRMPSAGVVNLHPSLLPRYRGRASINWAILRGETELGLTAHFVDEGMDTGDVIAQRRYSLREDEDVGDALEKLYPLYAEITREVLGHFERGAVPRNPQAQALASAFPRRRPEDGRIDWRRPAREVKNLIRAVAAPYPGAFGEVEGGTLRVWKAGQVLPFRAGELPTPGTIVREPCGAVPLAIACADAAIELAVYEKEAATTAAPELQVA